jgi:two-component system, LytTR family, response regulator
MRKWRVAIVDDEPIARLGLRRMLAAVDDAELVGEAGSAPDALRLLLASEPEIVFLDVHLPGGDAFDVLARTPSGVIPTVIFVTAFEEFAVRAFDFDAVDFLLKPFDEVRFRRAWDRAIAARRSLGTVDGSARTDISPAGGRLLLRRDGFVEVVALRDIEWIEAADNYVVVHTPRVQYRWRMGIAEAARRLRTSGFARAHRSALINARQVVRLLPNESGDGRVVLRSGAPVPFSRRFRPELEEMLRAVSS